MSVTLRTRINSNGSTSLRLDINFNGKRWIETLQNIKIITHPSTPEQRQKNKDNMALAEKIAFQRGQELDAGQHDIDLNQGKKILVVDWMQSYVNKYKKKDLRNMQGVLNRFKSFLDEQKIKALSFAQLKEHHIIDFQDYLLAHSIGEGSSSYFARFKRLLKRARQEGIIKYNPAQDVRTKGIKARKKDVLSTDEIITLSSTPIESVEIRRAALFCTMCGLRWIDVKQLEWKNIRGNSMSIRQTKTQEDLDIPLNNSALKLLGKRGEGKVFNLPSANGANKTLGRWVKRAKIDKKITWHNLRHSYGTALISLGTDVLTTSKLLGHKSLRHTQRYIDSSKELKEAAINKLDIL